MNTASRTYIALIALVAVTILAALWPFTAPMQAEEVAAVILLVLLSFASDLMYVYGGQGEHQTSVAFVPFLACMVLFPPSVSVPAIAASVLLSNLFPTRRAFWKLLFNVSQTVVAAGIAAAAYHELRNASATFDLVAFAVCSLAFTTLNFALLAGVVARIQQIRFASVLSDLIGAKAVNLVHALLASPLALMIVVLYAQFDFPGIAVVLLPLLLVKFSLQDRASLKRANKDLIMVLIKAIETRDPYTSGHSLRVAMLAALIAKDLRLPVWRVEQIETAALLHDVGKIDPSFEAVIRKPYDLTPEERSLIQQHAVMGAEMLKNLKSVPDYIVKAVRHHHERMDGKGYPDGISGESIPLPARIIMLCDSIDAMLSDRPYRKALSMDRVRQELIKCSGAQFDPEIVKVVLQRDTLSKAETLVHTVSDVEQQYLIKARA